MKTKMIAVVTVNSLLTFGAVSLYAQTATGTAAGSQSTGQDSRDATLMDEILVTAQKREEDIFDVPLAVQAFSGVELEKTGIRDIVDIVNFIPGASQGRSNTIATRSYQIRGVSSYYGESTVGYYLDEAAFSVPNRNYAPLARTFDVERVEVLRGPQGTLYGQSAMGGTMRFITADPDMADLRFRGDAGFSNTEGGEDNYYSDLAVSAPIVKDVLAVRAVAGYEHKGGFAESPSFPGDTDEDTLENYRFKVKALPTEDLTVKLMYQHSESEDYWGKNYVSAENPSFPAAIHPGRNDSEQDVTTAYLSYDVGAALLESSTGYIEREDAGLGPFSGLPLPVPTAIAELSVGADSEVFTQELRAVSQLDSPLKWVGGVIYQTNEATEAPLLQVYGMGPAPLAFVDQTSTHESDSIAYFGEVSYDLMDGKLTPLFGLRYFEDDRDYYNYNQPPAMGPGPLPAAQITHAAESFDSTSPRFNVAYTPTDDQHYYVNVAKGFRSGTFNTNAAIDAANSIGIPAPLGVDPDEIWSYEIGGKWDLADNRLRIETTVYYFDWKDQQLAFQEPVTRQSITVNAADSIGTGLEYAITWRALDSLTLQVSGNFNETEFDQIHNPEVFAGTPQIAEGKQIASVPEQSHSASADYRTPLGIDGLDLVLSGTYSFIDEQGDPGDPASRMGDSHELVGLRGGVAGEHWGTTLFVDNALDDDGAIWITGSGETRYYPRVIGLEVSFDY